MMTPKQWDRIKSVFNKLDSFPTMEQLQQLEQACAGDEALKEEVAKLLSPDPKVLAMLENNKIEFEEPQTELALPVKLGEFTLVEKIGAGGMGTVYRGVREQEPGPFNVAIKVLRKGFFSATRMRFFRKEFEILSYLNHPNIAKSYQTGILEDGQPYIVMEYVEGLPLNRYTHSKKLDLNQRIRLFLQVCNAVTYAHQNLVVHRDLKPSNILVTDDGVVKLLDFGIAKILKPDPARPAETTAVGERPFTFGYASPEQILGTPTSTTTDVYTLGILLYELLTGSKPLPKVPDHVFEGRKAMVVADPLRPSKTCKLTDRQTGGSRPPQIDPDFYRHLGLTPSKLAKALAGDLDSIIMRALENSPEDRYPSADRLAADLDRHLRGMPVSTSQDSGFYLLGKWIRRHRLAFGAALASIGITATFLVILTLQNHRIGVQWRRAEVNLKRSNLITAYLTEIFENTDPFIADGEELTARELLDRGLERLEPKLASEPLAKAAILHSIAGSYLSLSLPDSARRLYDEAYQLRKTHLGERHLETSYSLASLGRIYMNQNHYEKAEKALRQVLEIQTESMGVDQIGVANLKADLGQIYGKNQQFDKAEAQFKEALAILENKMSGKGRAAYGNALNVYARTLKDKGDFARSETYFLKAIAVKEKQLGRNHPGVANALNDLAVLYRQTDRLEEAESYLSRSYALTESAFGRLNSKTITVANNLAANLRAQGRIEEAETIYRDILAAIEEQPEKDIGLKLISANNLATSLMGRGQLSEAEVWLKESHSILNGMTSPPAMTKLIVTTNLAVLYHKQDRFWLADPLFDRAQTMVTSMFGDKHPATAKVLHKYALALAKVGCDAQAIDAFNRSFQIRSEVLGLKNIDTITGFFDMADFLTRTTSKASLTPMNTTWKNIQVANQDDANPRKQVILKKTSGLFGSADQ